MTITNIDLASAIPLDTMQMSDDEILAKISMTLRRPSFEFEIHRGKNWMNVRHEQGSSVWVVLK